MDFNSCHGIFLMAKVFMSSKNEKTNSWKKYKDRIFGSGIPEPQLYYRELPFHTLLILFHKNLVLVILK